MIIFKNLHEKAVLIFGIIICFLAVTSKSIWIDEGITYYFVNSHSLWELLKKLFLTTYSEAYMPGYILLQWVYCSVVGVSEYGMRSFNIIFGLISIFSFYRISIVLGKRHYFWLFIVQPFFWYYMNEARPYSMLIGLSSVLCLELVKNIKQNSSSVCVNRVILCVILLNLSSLLSFVFTGIFILFFLSINNREFILKIKTKIYFSVAINFLIASYFFWRLVNGASASKSWEFTYKNVLYSIIDILGFSGVIISKDELIKYSHDGGLFIIMQCMKGIEGIAIVILTISYVIILWVFISNIIRKFKKLESVLFYIFIVSLCSQIAISILFSWPFWGRHIFYLLPLSIIIIGSTLDEMTLMRSRLTLCILLLLLGYSSYNIRFNYSYSKDDYEKAAQIAKNDALLNLQVLWVANDICGQYYKLDFEGGKIKFWDQYHDKLPFKEIPSTIIYSKKHVFDSGGVIEEWISSNSFFIVEKFPGFIIYKKL